VVLKYKGASPKLMFQRLAKFRLSRKAINVYLNQSRRIWEHLPGSVRLGLAGRIYGRHLHSLVCLRSERRQNHSTFFLRNRPELELISRLVAQKTKGSSLSLTVVACSKGAEVYSFLWALRSARPDLRIHTQALDISKEIVEFAERGIYSRGGPETAVGAEGGNAAGGDATWRDQPLSIFERMTAEEVEAMFEVTGDQARVRPWLKEGITWRTGDALDPQLVGVLGLQDVVVANRFLCHMDPDMAEKCLRNIARLVKPGGYLFVSGVDLDVRTRVASALGWKPVPDMIKEVHEGDASLTDGWPLEWWGLEPFCHDWRDWTTRYACVFQLGQMS